MWCEVADLPAVAGAAWTPLGASQAAETRARVRPETMRGFTCSPLNRGPQAPETGSARDRAFRNCPIREIVRSMAAIDTDVHCDYLQKWRTSGALSGPMRSDQRAGTGSHPTVSSRGAAGRLAA
ncbi:hypothetical protein GCM10009798_44240 [Nocardioides panacihumi]|uniref:Transposase n=1 Tax=Nocardioides panacihumi TaxID=400774 RepID=A0ABN2S0N0_9ACTN